MKIERVKLSPKKGGNGYTSSFSLSIGLREAELCSLINGKIIKIIDEKNQQIVFRAKRFTVTDEVLENVYRYKRAEAEESNCQEDGLTYDEMMKAYFDRVTGITKHPAWDAFYDYLTQLPIEVLADLVLLMYMGRDFNADLKIAPGEKRFLDYFEYYGDIVLGKEKEVLVDILMSKSPLVRYLMSGIRVMNAPSETNMEDLWMIDRQEHSK